MKVKLFLVAALLSCVSARPQPVEWEYRSPLCLAADPAAGVLYVAESTAARVSVVDLADENVKDLLLLPEPPSGLVYSPKESALFVTGGHARGRVFQVDPERGKIERTIDVGHTPCAPALSPNEAMLYVCNRFDDSVSVIDLEDGEECARIAVGREPIAAALTKDGALLLVACHLPSGPADGNYAASEVVVVALATRSVRSRIRLVNGSTALRDVCVTPDGRWAFVTHILARYHHPTTQLERGWINTNALSVLDLRGGGRLLNTVLLDRPERGAANPWGVACTSDGESLVVTHAGSHAVSVIDVPGLVAKLADVPRERAKIVPDDLVFLEGLRRRIELAGNGPRGVAVVGDAVYAAEYFSDTIGVVELSASRPQARSISLGPVAPLTIERRGEMLFHDAKICFQEWQSCSSCHPDGRTDGLNWDLLNDGFGNPKNTKSLLLSHRTPPAMAMGIRDDAESGVRSGIRFILFAERPEEEACAMDAWLSSLEPLPSPRLEDGGLSPAARRGRAVFESTGCVDCHPDPLFTDRASYDLASTRGLDEGRPLDTPTLVELWRTAPYLHDGRAASVRALLLDHNDEMLHGDVSALTPEELNDLVEYVLSL